MNLPKQSRLVIRDVSHDPIRAQVEGAQNGVPGGPGWVIPPIDF
jgi:hypothetical protein